MRAWLICPMISSKCAALFPESLIITIYNLHKEIWYCKNSKSFKTKRSQKSLKTCHFNSTFVINWYFTDFFTNENPRKFVEKQKDDNFILLHFHVYLDTSKRTITQRTFAPEDFLPRGNFGQENFPPGGFCPRKTLFAKENFWAVQRPLGSMFAVLWYEMSYENVLRRFGDFCIVVEAVLCTAQRLNINPCFPMNLYYKLQAYELNSRIILVW